VRFKCKTKDVIGPLKDDKNVLVMDDYGMSQMLNNYFSSVFSREPVNFNFDLLKVEHIYNGDQQNKLLDVVISANSVHKNSLAKLRIKHLVLMDWCLIGFTELPVRLAILPYR